MDTFSAPQWQAWSELPFLTRVGPLADLQICRSLVEGVREAGSLPEYLKVQLPEIATEIGANWAAVLRRGSQWEHVSEFGRPLLEASPNSFLADVLDRDAGGFLIGTSQNQSVAIIAIPLRRAGEPELLVLVGRNLTAKMLPLAMAAARTLGLCIDLCRRLQSGTIQVSRLRSTLAIVSQLGQVRETVPLLELIAKEAARLLDCDRASIFLWDKPHKEMVACPALGVEEKMLRLPDSAGIVGESLQTGRVIRVDDAYQDPRFNRQIDLQTGYHTRNLLCVPLQDPTGERIGVFEAINKLHGSFQPEDEDSLRDLGLQISSALQSAQERELLTRRNRQLTEQVTQGSQIIGESPAIVALRATLDRLASTDLPVLILGESGTGKEVVAQALHYRGPRADHPFVAVNCAALTETLLESELFGHEKGAFTDAHESRPGKFELAEGGTLFLDEIGDMSAGGQAKLLRVLEQKVITRVGGSQNLRINVRVVAATNANLAQKVRERKFREDLYYRLSVVALELPPLRDRPEDILPLAEFFLERFSRQAGRPRLGLTPDARRRLQAHGWPGNIRELRNLMERVAFLCLKDRVDTDDLAFILSPDRDSLDDSSTDLGLSEATARFQREYIRRMIKRVKNNMSQAAELMGLHRSNLYRKMRQLRMDEVAGEEDIDELI